MGNHIIEGAVIRARAFAALGRQQFILTDVADFPFEKRLLLNAGL